MCNDIDVSGEDEAWVYKSLNRIRKRPTGEQVDAFLYGVAAKVKKGADVDEARRLTFGEVFNVR